MGLTHYLLMHSVSVPAPQKMPRSLNVKLAWMPLTHLLTSAALQLLTCSCSLSLFPTLAPPLHVVINGERKTLVLCLVSELPEDALDTIWFSNGNGSLLESFNYGISKDEDGTFSTISQISISTKEFELWNMVTCYVAQNETSRAWSNTSLPISEENMGDPCLPENQGAQDQILSTEVLHSSSQVLLLLAIRVLLFKFLLFDVLMTCCILYKKKDVPSPLKASNTSTIHPHRVRASSVPVNYYYNLQQTNFGTSR